MGPHDGFFAAEAREQLDQLERLVALPEPPDPEAMLRLSAGVRSSAQRAGAFTLAQVAERLEDAARSILGANIAWSDEVRALSRQTIDDLKLLLRALNRWGPEEERRVRIAIERWDEHEAAEATPAAASAADEAVPIASLFYDDAGPHVVEPEAGQTREEAKIAAVVPIERLLLRGDAALEAALALRPALEAIARGDAVPERPLPELVQELFELLELARSSEPAEV